MVGRFKPTSDTLFKVLTAILASVIIVVIGLTAYTLVRSSYPVLTKFGFRFVTGIYWNPIPPNEIFGALPYLLGTIVTSAIAIFVGVPVSIAIAIFLAEMAPDRVAPFSFFFPARFKISIPFRSLFSNLIELLAAVPSVIYGLWGLFVFRFWVSDLIEKPIVAVFGTSIPILAGSPFGLDILTAGLILAIMIIPTVSSISKEVMMAVPSAQREAAYAIGATRWETVKMSVLSYGRSGIFGATILGLGRAVGETMAVTMVIGNAIGASAVPTSLFKPGQTMASLIANEFNEADPTSLHPAALIGVGLLLFALAAAINIFAQLLVWKILKVRGGAVE
jgi:phosphate transport system permease protein